MMGEQAQSCSSFSVASTLTQNIIEMCIINISKCNSFAKLLSPNIHKDSG